MHPPLQDACLASWLYRREMLRDRLATQSSVLGRTRPSPKSAEVQWQAWWWRKPGEGAAGFLSNALSPMCPEQRMLNSHMFARGTARLGRGLLTLAVKHSEAVHHLCYGPGCLNCLRTGRCCQSVGRGTALAPAALCATLCAPFCPSHKLACIQFCTALH